MIAPCPLCGYDAPAEPCPHCAGAPPERSLTRRLAGPLSGLKDGLEALPRGLYYLVTTRGVKRWLAPPVILTTAIMIAALWWSFGAVGALLQETLPEQLLVLDGEWTWLEELPERWGWLKSAFAALVAALQWTLDAGWGLVTSQPLRLLLWFFLGSLVAWYCFSIAYEALAGPFLDEIQGRLEVRWFGADPRSRLERPNDLAPERCAQLTTWSALGASAVFLLLFFLPWPPWWLALAALPLGFLPAVLREPRYAGWLRWMAKVEARATLASLQASIVTGILILFALPLYFVPWVGYFLFAGVCGFATAVGLLDIPLERRGWPLRMRLRFILRHLLPLIAFGGVAGLLLAVPIAGPLLMVPSASLGGLWLVCRLDKGPLRAGAR